MTANPGAALILGAGPGLGAALSRAFAAAGHVVVLAARRPDRLQPVIDSITAAGGTAHARDCDATDEGAVKSLVGLIEQDIAPLAVAIHNASGFARAPIAEMNAADYERAWRVSAFGGFLLGREAARHMLPRGAGTILFTGATASKRGGAGFAGFAGGKFALRALAESMARELGPKGIHVAHVVIDGQIGVDPAGAKLDPDAIAATYLALHRQPKSAWTFDVDLRPAIEKF